MKREPLYVFLPFAHQTKDGWKPAYRVGFEHGPKNTYVIHLTMESPQAAMVYARYFVSQFNIQMRSFLDETVYKYPESPM